MSAKALPEVTPDRCTGCAQCAVVCPFNAIDMVRVAPRSGC